MSGAAAVQAEAAHLKPGIAIVLMDRSYVQSASVPSRALAEHGARTEALGDETGALRFAKEVGPC